LNDAKYWLGFCLIPEIGYKRFRMLLERFETAGAAWNAPEANLRAVGLENNRLSALLAKRDKLDLDAELLRVERFGARLITQADDEYPSLLRSLADAPPLLFVRGEITDDDALSIAIVGTRRASTYGKDAATYFSRELAANGVTIISGLAHGVDAAAHRAAIQAGGRTLAVLGCGIDQVYPREHGHLAAEIARHGAVISEFPPGTKPEAYNFPRRNRIVSGLSLGVLVVEAPEKSGALITATAAAEQGRDVFAVPGNIFNPMGMGANRLIQDGAKLVTTVDDVLEELNLAQVVHETRKTTVEIAPEGDDERRILGFLSTEPAHVDEIARNSGIVISKVTGTLTILELKGLARMVGPMQYSLTPRR